MLLWNLVLLSFLEIQELWITQNGIESTSVGPSMLVMPTLMRAEITSLSRIIFLCQLIGLAGRVV